MKTEESFYIKILIWAYNQTNGFTEKQLFDEFKIEPGSTEYKLYLKLFRSGNTAQGSTPTIENFKYENEDDVHFFCLSDKGMASAIDYLDLKEARESSKHARRIALWSIWIAVIVGLFQIFPSLAQTLMDFFAC